MWSWCAKDGRKVAANLIVHLILIGCLMLENTQPPSLEYSRNLTLQSWYHYCMIMFQFTMLNIKLLYHHQTFNANQNLEVSMVEECKSGRLTRDIWPQSTPGSSITTKLASAARGINILHCNGAKTIECEMKRWNWEEVGLRGNFESPRYCN